MIKQCGSAVNHLLDVVHRSDGALGIVLVGVAHEAKPTATTRIAVFNDDLNSGIKVSGCAKST